MLAVRKNMPKTSRFASLPPQPGQVSLLPATQPVQKIKVFHQKNTSIVDDCNHKSAITDKQILKNTLTVKKLASLLFLI